MQKKRFLALICIILIVLSPLVEGGFVPPTKPEDDGNNILQGGGGGDTLKSPTVTVFHDGSFVVETKGVFIIGRSPTSDADTPEAIVSGLVSNPVALPLGSTVISSNGVMDARDPSGNVIPFTPAQSAAFAAVDKGFPNVPKEVREAMKLGANQVIAGAASTIFEGARNAGFKGEILIPIDTALVEKNREIQSEFGLTCLGGCATNTIVLEAIGAEISAEKAGFRGGGDTSFIGDLGKERPQNFKEEQPGVKIPSFGFLDSPTNPPELSVNEQLLQTELPEELRLNTKAIEDLMIGIKFQSDFSKDPIKTIQDLLDQRNSLFSNPEEREKVNARLKDVDRALFGFPFNDRESSGENRDFFSVLAVLTFEKQAQEIPKSLQESLQEIGQIKDLHPDRKEELKEHAIKQASAELKDIHDKVVANVESAKQSGDKDLVFAFSLAAVQINLNQNNVQGAITDFNRMFDFAQENGINPTKLRIFEVYREIVSPTIKLGGTVPYGDLRLLSKAATAGSQDEIRDAIIILGEVIPKTADKKTEAAMLMSLGRLEMRLGHAGYAEEQQKSQEREKERIEAEKKLEKEVAEAGGTGFFGSGLGGRAAMLEDQLAALKKENKVERLKDQQIENEFKQIISQGIIDSVSALKILRETTREVFDVTPETRDSQEFKDASNQFKLMLGTSFLGESLMETKTQTGREKVNLEEGRSMVSENYNFNKPGWEQFLDGLSSFTGGLRTDKTNKPLLDILSNEVTPSIDKAYGAMATLLANGYSPPDAVKILMASVALSSPLDITSFIADFRQGFNERSDKAALDFLNTRTESGKKIDISNMESLKDLFDGFLKDTTLKNIPNRPDYPFLPRFVEIVKAQLAMQNTLESIGATREQIEIAKKIGELGIDPSKVGIIGTTMLFNNPTLKSFSEIVSMIESGTLSQASLDQAKFSRMLDLRERGNFEAAQALSSDLAQTSDSLDLRLKSQEINDKILGKGLFSMADSTKYSLRENINLIFDPVNLATFNVFKIAGTGAQFSAKVINMVAKLEASNIRVATIGGISERTAQFANKLDTAHNLATFTALVLGLGELEYGNNPSVGAQLLLGAGISGTFRIGGIVSKAGRATGEINQVLHLGKDGEVVFEELRFGNFEPITINSAAENLAKQGGGDVTRVAENVFVVKPEGAPPIILRPDNNKQPIGEILGTPTPTETLPVVRSDKIGPNGESVYMFDPKAAKQGAENPNLQNFFDTPSVNLDNVRVQLELPLDGIRVQKNGRETLLVPEDKIDTMEPLPKDGENVRTSTFRNDDDLVIKTNEIIGNPEIIKTQIHTLGTEGKISIIIAKKDTLVGDRFVGVNSPEGRAFLEAQRPVIGSPGRSTQIEAFVSKELGELGQAKLPEKVSAFKYYKKVDGKDALTVNDFVSSFIHDWDSASQGRFLDILKEDPKFREWVDTFNTPGRITDSHAAVTTFAEDMLNIINAQKNKGVEFFREQGSTLYRGYKIDVDELETLTKFDIVPPQFLKPRGVELKEAQLAAQGNPLRDLTPEDLIKLEKETIAKTTYIEGGRKVTNSWELRDAYSFQSYGKDAIFFPTTNVKSVADDFAKVLPGGKEVGAVLHIKPDADVPKMPITYFGQKRGAFGLMEGLGRMESEVFLPQIKLSQIEKIEIPGRPDLERLVNVKLNELKGIEAQKAIPESASLSAGARPEVGSFADAVKAMEDPNFRGTIIGGEEELVGFSRSADREAVWSGDYGRLEDTSVAEILDEGARAYKGKFDASTSTDMSSIRQRLDETRRDIFNIRAQKEPAGNAITFVAFEVGKTPGLESLGAPRARELAEATVIFVKDQGFSNSVAVPTKFERGRLVIDVFRDGEKLSEIDVGFDIVGNQFRQDANIRGARFRTYASESGLQHSVRIDDVVEAIFNFARSEKDFEGNPLVIGIAGGDARRAITRNEPTNMQRGSDLDLILPSSAYLKGRYTAEQISEFNRALAFREDKFATELKQRFDMQPEELMFLSELRDHLLKKGLIDETATLDVAGFDGYFLKSIIDQPGPTMNKVMLYGDEIIAPEKYVQDALNGRVVLSDHPLTEEGFYGFLSDTLRYVRLATEIEKKTDRAIDSIDVKTLSTLNSFVKDVKDNGIPVDNILFDEMLAKADPFTHDTLRIDRSSGNLEKVSLTQLQEMFGEKTGTEIFANRLKQPPFTIKKQLTKVFLNTRYPDEAVQIMDEIGLKGLLETAGFDIEGLAKVTKEGLEGSLDVTPATISDLVNGIIRTDDVFTEKTRLQNLAREFGQKIACTA